MDKKKNKWKGKRKTALLRQQSRNLCSQFSLPFNKKVEGAMEIGEYPLAYGENKYI